MKNGKNLHRQVLLFVGFFSIQFFFLWIDKSLTNKEIGIIMLENSILRCVYALTGYKEQ